MAPLLADGWPEAEMRRVCRVGACRHIGALQAGIEAQLAKEPEEAHVGGRLVQGHALRLIFIAGGSIARGGLEDFRAAVPEAKRGAALSGGHYGWPKRRPPSPVGSKKYS